MTNHVIEGAKGLAASGMAAAPAPIYGNSFLMTNGFGALNFAEWMQVLGSIYIIYLLSKGFANSSVGKKIIGKVKSWFNRE